METKKILTVPNEEFREVATQLAEIYTREFKKPPWNEISRCANQACEVGFSNMPIGTICTNCDGLLIRAYEVEELVDQWSNLLRIGKSCILLTCLDEKPQMATIATVTTPNELFNWKYRDVPAMSPWLESNFSGQFCYIVDTFADRSKKPAGNLKNRGTDLLTVARSTRTDLVVTRTLAPEIVSATVRDIPRTSVYLGSKAIGALNGSSLAVPDERTLLTIPIDGANS